LTIAETPAEKRIEDLTARMKALEDGLERVINYAEDLLYASKHEHRPMLLPEARSLLEAKLPELPPREGY
jgi:hypothetical protein